jgi:lysine-N-methylase
MEHYQPEFVVRFLAENTACDCKECQAAEGHWPLASIKFNQQQRDSLDVSCESAAKQMLLNPEAFVLHANENNEAGDSQPDLWLEMLNQQCLNLAMHPALTVETALFAIGILLDKAQQYRDAQQNDTALLVAMTEKLEGWAEQGVLVEQYIQLPKNTTAQAGALKSLSAQCMNFNLPMMDKMTISLKIGELNVMNEAQLVDRLNALQQRWDALKLTNNMAVIARNSLMYKLYNDVFPGGGDAHYGEKFLQLTQQFFQLKMLLAIWAETGNELTDDVLVSMYCSCYQVQKNNVIPGVYANDGETALLYALSLI